MSCPSLLSELCRSFHVFSTFPFVVYTMTLLYFPELDDCLCETFRFHSVMIKIVTKDQQYNDNSTYEYI